MLVETAAQFDVGVIPYMYPYPYSHCSPNKLSQYLSAGCAILHHDGLHFVTEVVGKAKAGYSANFADTNDLRRVITEICDKREDLQAIMENAKIFSSTDANWSSAVKPAVAKIAVVINRYRSLNRWNLRTVKALETPEFQSSGDNCNPGYKQRFLNKYYQFAVKGRALLLIIPEFILFSEEYMKFL